MADSQHTSRADSGLSRHTPGPWRKCGGATAPYIAICSPDDEYIVYNMAHHGITEWAEGGNIQTPDNETQAANARLIAAAPTMLAEMRRYLPILEAMEADSTLWAAYTRDTGVATTNGYRAAITSATDGGEGLRVQDSPERSE